MGEMLKNHAREPIEGRVSYGDGIPMSALHRGSLTRRGREPAAAQALADLVRSRIGEAACRPVSGGSGALELWFSPITGCCFAMPERLLTPGMARDVLIQAGLATHGAVGASPRPRTVSRAGNASNPIKYSRFR